MDKVTKEDLQEAMDELVNSRTALRKITDKNNDININITLLDVVGKIDRVGQYISDITKLLFKES